MGWGLALALVVWGVWVALAVRRKRKAPHVLSWKPNPKDPEGRTDG